MKIFSNQPNYTQFIKNEVDTLIYLETRAFFNGYSELSQNITQARLQYTSKLKKDNLIHFDFHSEFLMEVENALRYVIIGANVTENFNECSYLLAVTDKDDKNQLIRKFHFDFANSSSQTQQQVPSFHMQYGGKASPHMVSMDISKLDTWLSLPRLNFYPINLAFLLDIAFCEFRTVDTNKIVESPEWRTLIFNNEKFLTQNFYQNIYSHLSSSSHKSSYLLRDFCYGV